MIELNPKKLQAAKGFITQAHEKIYTTCRVCAGNGDYTSSCQQCQGNGYVSLPRYYSFSLESRIDYWQARALLAETELNELRASKVGEKTEAAKQKPTFRAKAYWIQNGIVCQAEVANKDDYSKVGLFASFQEAKEGCSELYEFNKGYYTDLVYVIYDNHNVEICRLDNGLWSDEPSPTPVTVQKEEDQPKKESTCKTTVRFVTDDGTLDKNKLHVNANLGLDATKAACERAYAFWKHDNEKRRYLYQVYRDGQQICWMQDGVWHEGAYKEPEKEEVKKEENWMYTPIWKNNNRWDMYCMSCECLTEAKRKAELKHQYYPTLQFLIIRSDAKIVSRLEKGVWVDC